MDGNHLYKPAHVLHFRAAGTSLLRHHQAQHGVCHQPDNQGYGARHRLVRRTFGQELQQIRGDEARPRKSTVVSAPLIEESPLCIECRGKEIVALGSHDMFIADVVNVRADTSHLNTETGKLELAESNLLVYVHGGYYGLGEKIGKFGWSVEKKK